MADQKITVKVKDENGNPVLTPEGKEVTEERDKPNILQQHITKLTEMKVLW